MDMRILKAIGRRFCKVQSLIPHQFCRFKFGLVRAVGKTRNRPNSADKEAVGILQKITDTFCPAYERLQFAKKWHILSSYATFEKQASMPIADSI